MLHDTSDEGQFECETGLFSFSWLLQTLSTLYIHTVNNKFMERGFQKNYINIFTGLWTTPNIYNIYIYIYIYIYINC